MNNKDMTVVVVSCDNYEDTWEACSLSLRKFWKDCPYDTILVTESRKPKEGLFDDVIYINSTDWAERICGAMKQISSQFVFFMLEDQWPVKEVNQGVVENTLNYMKQNGEVGIVYIEAEGLGGTKQEKEYDDTFNEIVFGSPYRLSCAPAIFRRDFLEKATEVKCSAWEFERKRSFDEVGKNVVVLDLKKTIWKRLDAPGAINRGKWVPRMRDYSKTIGVKIDYEKRKELSRSDILKLKLKGLIFRINPTMIVKIQNELDL